MNILLLSPHPERLNMKTGYDSIVESNAEWDPKYLALRNFDWIISYGYRHILRNTDSLPPIINLHISFLPWNRGADPNYWSWRDDTPKGVTIHKIDDGIDTGPIYAQREVPLEATTLGETYDKLHARICELFTEIWPLIRNGILQPTPQIGAGSFHRKKDMPSHIAKDAPINSFPRKYKTSCIDLIGLRPSDLDRIHGCGYIPRRKQHANL